MEDFEDFRKLTGDVRPPEARDLNTVDTWFSHFYADWKRDANDYSAARLHVAIKLLAEMGCFGIKLTFVPADAPKNVFSLSRPAYPYSTAFPRHDILAVPIGMQTAQRPFFVSETNRNLTLSYTQQGFICGFTNRQIGEVSVIPIEDVDEFERARIASKSKD